jgi:hypothetical protein
VFRRIRRTRSPSTPLRRRIERLDPAARIHDDDPVDDRRDHRLPPAGSFATGIEWRHVVMEESLITIHQRRPWLPAQAGSRS